MKPLAILDLETTSLDPATGEIIEAAVCLFDVDLGRIITARSWLVDTGNANPAEAINGIPSRLLLHGDSRDAVMRELAAVGYGAHAFVAHNAAFDRSWLTEIDGSAPWVCSMSDIEWPRQGTGKSLTSIALSHGVGVVAAHRALDDVLTLARVFERVAEMGHSLPDMIAKAMRPKATFEVADTRFDEARNAMSKAAGFRWTPEVKRWRKTMFRDDAASLPFAVQEVA